MTSRPDRASAGPKRQELDEHEVRRCPQCGVDVDNERHDDCPESVWYQVSAGRLPDPAQPKADQHG